MRLLQIAGAEFGHLDGILLSRGAPAGLSGMYPRQVCNTVMAIMLETRQGEARAEFLAEISAPMDPWAQADAVWSRYYPQQ